MVEEIQSWFRSTLPDWNTDHLRGFPSREADRTLYEVFVPNLSSRRRRRRTSPRCTRSFCFATDHCEYYKDEVTT